MPAIAGFIGEADRRPLIICSAMMAALEPLGGHSPSFGELSNACFGSQCHKTLPEDDFDRQPYVGAGGRMVFAADARVDNRDELANHLGISPAQLSESSDTELLLLGWERLGLALLNVVLGDIAFAAWHRESAELTLVRAPLSTRPIFFHRGADFLAFASHPSALFAIPAIAREPDMAQFARLAAGGIFEPGANSLFRGIESIPHGHAAVISEGRLRTVRLWSPNRQRLSISVAEAGEAIRAELERAVRAQSRRRGGPLACQLSSGRDSSAVAALAARLESRSGTVPIALTAAPAAGFPEISGSDWLGDESPIAAQTSAKVGLIHFVCRSRPTHLADLLDRIGKAHFQPLANPVNWPWIAQTYDAAQERGATVLLTGSSGNLGLSMGGAGFLGEIWRDRGPTSWWSLARNLHHSSATPWRQLVSLTFGHRVPRPIFSAIRTLTGRHSPHQSSLELLRMPFRQEAEALRRERLADLRHPASRRRWFSDMLVGLEPGDKYSLGTWGLDVRDPTADRRLIELCHSLPVEAFVDRDHARPAYEQAFGDLLPKEVVAGRRTGAQAADWFETINPRDVRDALHKLAGHPIVEQMLDVAAIDARIDAWPDRRTGGTDEAYELYCNQLLGVLALTSFVNTHFPR